LLQPDIKDETGDVHRCTEVSRAPAAEIRPEDAHSSLLPSPI